MVADDPEPRGPAAVVAYYSQMRSFLSKCRCFKGVIPLLEGTKGFIGMHPVEPNSFKPIEGLQIQVLLDLHLDERLREHAHPPPSKSPRPARSSPCPTPPRGLSSARPYTRVRSFLLGRVGLFRFRNHTVAVLVNGLDSYIHIRETLPHLVRESAPCTPPDRLDFRHLHASDRFEARPC
jgi:hypothetical protein